MEKLAINGGKPVRAGLLNYGRQTIDEDDIQAVANALRSDWLTNGPVIDGFEKAVADLTGAKHAVAVNSGTAALHAAMAAANIGPQDEVIVPCMTFVASANCVLHAGGKPVFSDVSADTLTLDPDDVERKISERTRAIIAMDYAGQACDYNELQRMAQAHGLLLIEDAAHALGATYNHRRVGSLNDLTTFSFHPVKHITTGEGGLVTTDDPGFASKIRSFRSHGVDLDFRQRAADKWGYDVLQLGYNYRLAEINCALGLSQLQHLDDWIGRRRQIAQQYSNAFSILPEINTPITASGGNHVWHLYVIQLNLPRLKVGRSQIFKALRAENIGVNVHYIPVPWFSLYQNLGYKKGQWPVAEAAYERIITLPLFPSMKDRDVEDVIRAVTKVIEHYSTRSD